MYFLGTDNYIYCYAPNGSELFSYATTNSGGAGNPEFTIDPVNNILYYTSDNGYLYGIYDQLAESPGTSYMSYNPGGTYGKIRMNYNVSLDSSGDVYFGTRQSSSPYDNYVLAIYPSTSSLVWDKYVGGEVYTTVEKNGISFAPTGDGLYAFNTSNGTNAWSSGDEGGTTATDFVSLGGSALYTVYGSYGVYSFAQSNDASNWSTGSSYGNNPITVAITNAGTSTDIIYTPTGVALKQDGTVDFTWTDTNLGLPVISLSTY